MTKELRGICSAVEKWAKRYNNNVEFICGFCAFNKKWEMTDNLRIGFGVKKSMKVGVRELLEDVNKEKGDFIDWQKGPIPSK